MVCMVRTHLGRKGGTAQLADCQGVTATYTVEEADNETSAGKKRIIWTIDEDELKNLFGGKVPTVSDEPPASREDTMMPMATEVQAVESVWSATIAGTKSLGNSSWKQDLSLPTRTSIQDSSQPTYLDGALVEYHSKTNSRWLRGRVSVQVARSEAGRYRLCYNVKLEQVRGARLDVALDMLRSPLEVDEHVAVFLKHQGGIWAPGKIVRSQRGRAASYSYDVQFDDGLMLHQVPPVRIRRTFAPGSSVEVWRGLRDGWVPAFVMEDTKVVQYPQPLSPWSPVPPSEEALVTPRSLRSPRSPRSMWMQSRNISKAFHPWIMVAVRDEDSGNAHHDMVEEVPLYLIRRPSKFSFRSKRRELI